MNKYPLTLIPAIAIATISCHFLLQRWNPYTLNGPRFLHFYVVLLSILYAGYILSLIPGRQNTLVLKFFPAILVWIGIGGIIRLIQGIFNAKPVGFLILLLIAHLTGCCIIWKINKNVSIKR